MQDSTGKAELKAKCNAAKGLRRVASIYICIRRTPHPVIVV